MMSPGMSMGMSMQLHMQQEDELQMRQTQLDDDDKNRLQRLHDLWNAKPHAVLSFDADDLRMVFAPSQARPALPGTVPAAPTGAPDNASLEVEYMELTPAEMAEVMPDEKVGGVVGNIYFVSSDTRKEYAPLVLLNVAVSRSIRTGTARDVMQRAGIDAGSIHADMQRHWSANLFDVVVAAKYFAGKEREFAEYMRWRRSVERSSFYLEPQFDDFVSRLQQDQIRRRTVHPMDRGRWNRHSWTMTAAVRGNGLQYWAKQLGASRVDQLYCELTEHCADRFDSTAMITLLRRLENCGSKDRLRLGTEPALDRQAYLLTEQVAGRNGAILRLEREGGSTYVPLLQAAKSARALLDRIALAGRQALESAGVDGGLRAALRLGRRIELQGFPQFDLGGDPSQFDAAYGKVDALAAELNRMEQELRVLNDELAKLAGTEHVVPASVQQEFSTIEAAREELDQRRRSLDQARQASASLSVIRKNLGALLEEIREPLPVQQIGSQN